MVPFFPRRRGLPPPLDRAARVITRIVKPGCFGAPAHGPMLPFFFLSGFFPFFHLCWAARISREIDYWIPAFFLVNSFPHERPPTHGRLFHGDKPGPRFSPHVSPRCLDASYFPSQLKIV